MHAIVKPYIITLLHIFLCLISIPAIRYKNTIYKLAIAKSMHFIIVSDITFISRMYAKIINAIPVVISIKKYLLPIFFLQYLHFPPKNI